MEQLGISFYGGEPLLNFPTIKEVILYANKRAREAGLPEVEYHLSTNATCLTSEMISFLREQPVSVLVSLDGPPSVHDRMRRFANGKPTHARVVASVERLLGASDGGLSVSGSAVVSPGVRLLDAYRYLQSIGLQDIKISYVHYHDAEFFGPDKESKDQYIGDLRSIAQDFIDRRGRSERGCQCTFIIFSVAAGVCLSPVTGRAGIRGAYKYRSACCGCSARSSQSRLATHRHHDASLQSVGRALDQRLDSCQP